MGPRKLPPTPSLFAKDMGKEAFHKGDYTQAIQNWSQQAHLKDPELLQGLGEAHFRRALMLHGVPPSQVREELESAVAYCPQEPRYWYHLGLLCHRENRLEEAKHHYTQAKALHFHRPWALDYVLGLVTLEENSHTPLGELPPVAQAMLQPIQCLLQSELNPMADVRPLDTSSIPKGSKGVPLAGSLTQLWRGIGQCGQGKWSEALVSLGAISGDTHPLPVECLRVYFYAQALNQTGKSAQAAKLTHSLLSRTTCHSLQHKLTHRAYDEIQALLPQQQWQTLAELSEKACEKRPGDAWLMLVHLIAQDQLAWAALAKQDDNTAYTCWQKALKVWGSQPLPGWAHPLHRNVANLATKRGNVKQAIAHWTAYLNALPKRVTKAMLQEGYPLTPEYLAQKKNWIEQALLALYRKSDNPKDEIDYFKSLIKKRPKDVSLRADYLKALENMPHVNLWDRVNEGEKALRLEPTNITVKCLLGQALLDMQQSSEQRQRGMTLLEEVLKHDPHHRKAKLGLGNYHFGIASHETEERRWQSALEALDRAAQYLHQDKRIPLQRGIVYLRAHKPKEAKAHFDQALEGANIPIYANVFEAWADANAIDEAKAVYQMAKDNNKLDPIFIQKAITCCKGPSESQQHRDRVAAFYKQWNKKQATAKSDYKKRTEPQQAKWRAFSTTLLQELIELDCSADELLMLFMEYRKEVPGFATACLKKVVAQIPDFFSAYSLLALHCALQGNQQEARDTLLLGEGVARRMKETQTQKHMSDMRSAIQDVPRKDLEMLLDSLCNSFFED